jgi:hypothetical protein
MKLRAIAAIALGVALSALPGSAQSAAEQLQKGIYAQQTAGDLDAAIQIFRQIVASNPTERAIAAQAQMHLAQALLQKGDLDGAAREFNTLAANYSEFREMLANMAGRVSGTGHNRVFSLGTVTLSQGEPDRYTNNLIGVSLTAPAGWKLEGDGDSSGGGQMVWFSSSAIKTDILAVWMKASTTTESGVAGSLRGSLAHKPQDRTDYTGWTVRPESVTNRMVAGWQALSAIADYTESDAKMVEYLLWVRSPKTQVFFFGRANAADLAALQSGLDQLAATAVIP